MPDRRRATNTATNHGVSAISSVRQSAARKSIVAPKLSGMQLAELLKPFWMDLLQNNLKNVKKFIRDNKQKLDLNAVRYTACADGTALHLCAQHGFIDCGKVVIDAGVGIDLQNKVGSTALHVACKFNQDQMVLFLLELGTQVIVPDLRNNIAFDVASFLLLDKCLFAPLRSSLEAEHQEEERLFELFQNSDRHFNEVKLAEAHANMLLIDWESRAWEERQLLQTTMVLDKECSDQVQRSKDQLEVKLATYAELQRLLLQEQDQIALTWKKNVMDARNRRQRAEEQLELMLMMEQEQEQHLMREQQDLLDQCGLIEAANEFPNDVDIQEWVLCTIIAILDEAVGSFSADTEPSSTGIDDLLVRVEIAAILRNVLRRFSTSRDLQTLAIRCLVRLVRLCTGKVESEHVSPKTIKQRSIFMAALIKDDVMTLTRDAVLRFPQDIKLAQLGVELLYHLLLFRNASGTHGMQFCQNRLTHQLPLQLFRLHETVHIQQDVGISLTSNDILRARYHTSLLLFCLTKYNVRKALGKVGVVEVAHRLVFEVSSSADGDEEVKLATLQYLLGSLALAHSPSASPPVWSVDDLTQLVEAMRPWILQYCADESEHCSKAHVRLMYWTMKLLRNLTSVVGADVAQLRIALRTRETFDLLSGVTLTIRGRRCSDDENADSNIVTVWLELVEDVWMISYNSDGQLATTPSFVLEVLLKLFELEAQLVELSGSKATFVQIAAVLKLVSKVLANSKNMRFLVAHEDRIDTAMQTTLTALCQHKVNQDAQQNQDEEADVFESLAHIFRIYLRLLDHERDEDNPISHFHDRYRTVGICVAVAAYKLTDTSIVSAALEGVRNINQSGTELPKTAGQLKSKMLLARTWSRTATETPDNHLAKTETLCALADAFDDFKLLVTELQVRDMTLEQTFELSSASWFGLLDLIWARGLRDVNSSRWTLAKLVHTEPRYYCWEFVVLLVQAIKRSDLAMVQWVPAHFSNCPVTKEVAAAAAENGLQSVLELLENDTSHGGIQWGDKAVKLAAQNSHWGLCRWLDVWSLGNGAMVSSATGKAKLSMRFAKGDDQCGQGGSAEVVQWLYEKYGHDPQTNLFRVLPGALAAMDQAASQGAS